ncbi:hypothetical protein [Mucilaginibacter terrae]|uniref:Uncharacterized protein n=1 Tax=Mucilaginibacter terrae TaxID=1955052 RepID=A0ABU3GNH0_9SPHI|nr:hypothetical protein [Mucilaginibacter terrae]MDT3401292.1 hypothetical protein [Mucilaginibacter terrae]
MNTENLDGTLVLVKPEPHKGEDQYRIGVLTYAWWRENPYVRFLDGGSMDYKAGHVMMFKSKYQLYEHMTIYGLAMKPEELMPMFKIFMLLEKCSIQSLIWAMEIVRDHPNLHHRILDLINLEQTIMPDRGMGLS